MSFMVIFPPLGRTKRRTTLIGQKGKWQSECTLFCLPARTRIDSAPPLQPVRRSNSFALGDVERPYVPSSWGKFMTALMPKRAARLQVGALAVAWMLGAGAALAVEGNPPSSPIDDRPITVFAGDATAMAPGGDAD